jgi:cobalt-zinc-cadmium efflux system membrane fusion protein
MLREISRRVIGGVLILACCGWLAGCRQGPQASTAGDPKREPAARAVGERGVVSIPLDSPRARQIKVDVVRVRDLPADELVAPARVGIDPGRTAKLLLPAPGRIVSVRVKLGDTVEEDRPLVMLDSPDAAAAMAAHLQAEAAHRQAAAALVKAEADFQRTKDLYEIRAVAQKELVGAQNDLAQAGAAVEAARANMAQSRKKIELIGVVPGDPKQLIAVRAPLAGKILDISVVPGEYRNDTSVPLMTITDLTRVWVAYDVPESAIRFIRVGDQVVLSLVAFPGETFTGPVARISDVLDPQSRTIKVQVDMPNPGGRLRPEMYGSIRHGGATRKVPALPPTAILQEYGAPVVWVERSPGRFERREVTTGPRAGDMVPILNGLREGERVVVDGGVLLKEQ